MAAAQSPLSPWNPDKKYSDRERWICIYPAYINSKKSRQEGRKVAKQYCVENPTFQEIKDVLSSSTLKVGVENKSYEEIKNALSGSTLNVIVENKMYPREKSKEFASRGRVRVQIKNDDGTLLSPNFPTRDSVLLHVGKLIPQLKSRQSGKSGGEGSSSQHNQAAAGSSKKGGKGKRR